jgi:hypothetical protein
MLGTNDSTTETIPASSSARAVAGGEGREHAHAGKRYRQSDSTPHQRQQQVLDEQELPQPCHAGAERGANDELVLAAHSAHEGEVRHVGACNDEHEGSRGHQQPERRLRLLAERFAERRDGDVVAGSDVVGFRKLLVGAVGDGGDLGTRLLDRRT